MTVPGAPDPKTLRYDDRGSRILAHGENATCCDFGIPEQSQGDHAIIVRRLLVIQDGRNLLQVPRPKHEGDVFDCFVRKPGDGFWRDLENLFPFKFRDFDSFPRNQAVVGLIWAEREGLVVGKIAHGWDRKNARGSSH